MTIIANGTILTPSGPLKGDLRIDDDGRIGGISSQHPSLPGTEVIDASGMIVMPGFIDTHRHTWQTAVKGVLPSCTLDEYFAGVLATLNPLYRPQDVYISNYMGALEALNAGITTMLDWSHISRTPEHADAAIKGLRDSGIRAVYSHGAPGSPDYWGGSSKGHPQDIRRIRKEVLSDDTALVTLGMSARAPGAVTDDVIKADWALARELGLRISVHAGYRRHRHHHQHIADLARLGALGPDTTCIHCTDSSDAELDLLAASGAFTSVAPYVEMLMGHGMPPTGKLLKRGIRPSLSIDVASSVPGDMFTQMRTALVAERILAMTATPDEKFAPTLTHKDVLEFATLQGARALGMAHTIGSLEVGKQADVVLLDARKVNTQPVVDPEGTVVVYADTSNIDTVMVGGVIRKRHGQLVANRLSDDFRLLNNSRDYLLNAAGMKTFTV